ncbi:hypothetical protein JNW90_35155 [Micromonospora sp. STR1s_5]|nr:hypothetical protein [Micromonospora sp. STR1s_5]
MKQLARGYSSEAIETLAAIMKDGEQSGAARVSAASVILDRAWGKAPQHITTDPLGDMSDEQLRQELVGILDELRSLGVGAESAKPARPNAPTQRTH